MKTIIAAILIAGMAMAQEAEPKPQLWDQLNYIHFAQTGKTMPEDPDAQPWQLYDDGYGNITIKGKGAPKLEDVRKVTVEQIATLPPKPLTPAEQEIADLKERIAELETKEAAVELRVKALEDEATAEARE